MLINVKFFVSQPDADVERLLKFFTFLPLLSIQETMEEHIQHPEKRVAQHKLAREFVELVHGSKEADSAERQHRFLFSQAPPKLEDILKNEPDVRLPISKVLDSPFSFALKRAGLAGSKSVGARLIKKGGAYVLLSSSTEAPEKELAFAPVVSLDNHLVKKHHLLSMPGSNRKLLILRSGKRKVCVVELLSDEEVIKMNLRFPEEEEQTV